MIFAFCTLTIYPTRCDTVGGSSSKYGGCHALRMPDLPRVSPGEADEHGSYPTGRPRRLYRLREGVLQGVLPAHV